MRKAWLCCFGQPGISAARKSRAKVFWPVTLAIASRRWIGLPSGPIQSGERALAPSALVGSGPGAMKPILTVTPAIAVVLMKSRRESGVPIADAPPLFAGRPCVCGDEASEKFAPHFGAFQY